MTNRPAGKSNDLGEERGELWGVLDRFRSTLFERGLTWVPFSGTGASYRDNRFHDGGQTDRTIPSNSFSKFFSRSPLRITALDARAVSRKGEEGKRVWCRKAANAAKGGGGGGREGTKNEAARDVTEEKRYGAEREGDGGETERERRALQRRGYASLRNYASFSEPYNCVIQTLLFPIRYILGSLAFRDASFSFFLSSPSLPLPRTFSRTSFRLSLGRGGRRGRDIRGRAKSGRAPVAQPLSTTRYR